MMKMVKCEKCGTELVEGAKYCHNCGARVKETLPEGIYVQSEDLIKKVKELIHEGNVNKIIVESDDGKTVLEIPVTIGVLGALLAPYLAALGAIAAVATRCKIYVEKRE